MGIIDVRELWYTYPNASNPSLKGLNMEIERGEFVLLTGPSGCGKTTFCRCLNGLIPHFYDGELRGDLRVSGLSTREHPIAELARHVGLVFQNPDNQIFALTVEKEVAFGPENLGLKRGEIIEAVEWALEVTGIAELRYRGTNELSGGQKQRLAIASVLAMRPEIIVLDEPTSFLDPLGAERIFEVLERLRREFGITIILIEHRVDLAVRYADRVIVFDEGRVIADGPPEEVFGAEESRLAGVGTPKIIELSKRLARRGLRIGGLPVSVEEFVSKMRKTLSTQGPPEVRRLRRKEPGFTSGTPIIEVEEIHYTYPNGTHAIDGVSLTLNRGEFLAIMGENGAGKTTLVKHFNGLLKPQRGRVLVDGLDTSKTSVAALARKVGLVFQNPDDQLFAESVEEEIKFGLRNFGFEDGVIEKRVEWALNLLDIERYRKSSPFTLSGGERKRVALASVLAWDPEVVVLDEPTIGQDYAQKERLRHFLMQLRTRGKTIITVTHDVEFVAENRPRVILMAGGRIIADGPMERIMTDFETLTRASIAPPEIAKAFRGLSDYGLPPDVFDVEEAAEILSTLLRRGGE
ncbi:MAG: energy-coupling factor transporter ATPase [Candidatus Bathyarchaeia archaeon]|nr:ATP-binding cassette domain-containing protein [Candidatus Bathyarchaeota archaeon]